MFCGEYQHTLDSKGRVIIPSKYRDELGEKFIITKGLDECLFGYSLPEFENIAAKLKQLPFTDADVRTFVRFFFAGASECEMDKQGRILIPQNLRDYAGMDKNVYIIGVSTRIEIWDKAKWDECSGNGSAISGDIAEKMAMLGV